MNKTPIPLETKRKIARIYKKQKSLNFVSFATGVAVIRIREILNEIKVDIQKPNVSRPLKATGFV